MATFKLRRAAVPLAKCTIAPVTPTSTSKATSNSTSYSTLLSRSITSHSFTSTSTSSLTSSARSISTLSTSTSTTTSTRISSPQLQPSSSKSISRHTPKVQTPLSKRTFLPDPFRQSSSSSSSSIQTLTAKRTLPYSALALFNVITDINSYPSFLPFCHAARVTAHSAPDQLLGKKWPARATLSVGYADAVTEFESLVYCIPPDLDKAGSKNGGEGVCEAISGNADVDLPAELIQHYLSSNGSQNSTASQPPTQEFQTSRSDKSNITVKEGPLSHLRTKWTLIPQTYNKLPAAASGFESDRYGDLVTEVQFSIEFAFRSALLEMVSKAATPKVADMMVSAFVERAEDVLGR